jgi:hypothetical protein
LKLIRNPKFEIEVQKKIDSRWPGLLKFAFNDGMLGALWNLQYMKSGKRSPGAMVLCIFLLFIAAPHSFAIIRSPFPGKSLPPDRGQVIIIGEERIAITTKNGR